MRPTSVSDGSPRDVQAARRLLREGRPLPTGLLSTPVASSWERTRSAGMQPDDQALFHHSVGAPERRRVEEAHRPLIEVAAPDMAQLQLSMGSSRWIVLLTNEQGTIVHALGQHDHAPRELRLPLHCGRRLLESELGTNAPGVALHDGQAVQVCGDEHYLEELRRFTCVAAPVHRPDGRLAGILDVTGFDTPIDPRMFGRVCRAARSIENRLFEQAAEQVGTGLLRLHDDPRFLGTPAEGLLWIDEDGRVLSMNAAARNMLGAPWLAQAGDPLHLQRLFDESTLRVLHRPPGDASTLAAHLADGAHVYLRLATSPSGSGRSASKTAAAPPPEAVGSTLEACGDPTWQDALAKAGKVLPRGLPVLVEGETGSGKEWFARALHQRHRPHRPFVAVNCSALTETLAEAELFGHVEGAYTGSRKGGAPGRLEQAHGGTLLLDEIGDMPLTLQTRLLRVLQERRLTRLGGQKEIALDLMVIAATHRDLAVLVAQGTFRQDLYFRLNGLKVRLPALREREDLDTLIDTCLHECAAGDAPSHLPESLRLHLRACPWPGNVRQLRHALQVATALAGAGGVIERHMLPDEVLLEAAPVAVTPTGNDLASVRRDCIRTTLASHGGNVSAAARTLGISRTTLYKQLKR